MKAPIVKNTEDMMLVAQVFESGSITAACQSTGLERTSLSRRLKALEGRVGVPLFDRSGQRIQLTDIGNTYLKYCRRIRELVEEAECCVTGRPMHEPGVLSVLADFDEAGLFLAPTLSEYSSLHSDVEFVVTLVAEQLRSIPDDSDLVIQVGSRRQPGVHFHELATLTRSIWAAPAIAAGAGFDDDPRLVENLPCLSVSDATDGSGNWRLTNGGYTIELPVLPRFRLPTLVACRDACISGLGLAVLPDYLCRTDEANGRLTRVFADWRPSAQLLTAAHHRSSGTSRRTRRFIEFCKGHNFAPAIA